MRSLRRSPLRAVPALLLGLALALPVEAQLNEALSSRDRRALANGRLIVRQTTERRGSLQLIGGTSFQVIDVPPVIVWRALHDTSKYSEMLPGASAARQTFHRGNDRGIHMRHGRGAVEASYHLNVSYIESSRVVMFRIDERQGGSLRAGWGFLKVQPFQGNRTLLSYGVLADMGEGILAGALRSRIHGWMLRVPRTVKHYIEGEGRDRYGSA